MVERQSAVPKLVSEQRGELVWKSGCDAWIALFEIPTPEAVFRPDSKAVPEVDRPLSRGLESSGRIRIYADSHLDAAACLIEAEGVHDGEGRHVLLGSCLCASDLTSVGFVAGRRSQEDSGVRGSGSKGERQQA